MGEVQSLGPIKTGCALSSCFIDLNAAAPLPHPFYLFNRNYFLQMEQLLLKGKTKLMLWALHWPSMLLEIPAVACLELIWTRLTTGCWGLLVYILQVQSCQGLLCPSPRSYRSLVRLCYCSWTGEVNGYPFCDVVQDDFYSSLLLSVRCLVSVHSQ